MLWKEWLKMMFIGGVDSELEVVLSSVLEVVLVITDVEVELGGDDEVDEVVLGTSGVEVELSGDDDIDEDDESDDDAIVEELELESCATVKLEADCEEVIVETKLLELDPDTGARLLYIDSRDEPPQSSVGSARQVIEHVLPAVETTLPAFGAFPQ